MFFEFFRGCYYIMYIKQLKSKRYGNKSEEQKGNDAATGH